MKRASFILYATLFYINFYLPSIYTKSTQKNGRAYQNYVKKWARGIKIICSTINIIVEINLMETDTH